MKQNTIDHAHRAHSILSPSAAFRWMHCTPSAKLEEAYPDTTSPAAEEGTLAHEVCERLVRCTDAKHIPTFEAVVADCAPKAITREMYNHALAYRAYAYDLKGADGSMDAELRLNLMPNIASDLFGTCDLVIRRKGKLDIIDYKYGKGIKVDAVGNPQMRIYALGALMRFQFDTPEPIKEVTMHIYQPRINNISSETLSVNALLSWANDILFPAARLAYKGEGTRIAGDHCTFCRARHACPQYACRATAPVAAALAQNKKPEELTPDELTQILAQADALRNYLASVEEWALSQALAGNKIAGYKLVAGRSLRSWEDPDKVLATLAELGIERDRYMEEKLLSVSRLEKELGKKAFAPLLPLVIKPEGKPTLVVDTDTRAEFIPNEQIKNAFND